MTDNPSNRASERLEAWLNGRRVVTQAFGVDWGGKRSWRRWTCSEDNRDDR